MTAEGETYNCYTSQLVHPSSWCCMVPFNCYLSIFSVIPNYLNVHLVGPPDTFSGPEGTFSGPDPDQCRAHCCSEKTWVWEPFVNMYARSIFLIGCPICIQLSSSSFSAVVGRSLLRARLNLTSSNHATSSTIWRHLTINVFNNLTSSSFVIIFWRRTRLILSNSLPLAVNISLIKTFRYRTGHLS